MSDLHSASAQSQSLDPKSPASNSRLADSLSRMTLKEPVLKSRGQLFQKMDSQPDYRMVRTIISEQGKRFKIERRRIQELEE